MFGRLILATIGTVALVAPAAADIGRVKRVVGTASVVRGGKALVPATGSVLERGDVLRTGKDGRISVTFVDNTRFSAGPNSVVELTKFQFDKSTHKGEFVTSVNRGSLAVVSGQIAHENPNAMRVKTPTSLLGVRGTRFIVNVE